jgi:hypothetical protein
MHLCFLDPKNLIIEFQIYIFVLDIPPESFHKHIVQCTPASIHTDAYTVRFKNTGEGVSGELAALIGVEYLGGTECLQRLLQTFYTESAIKCVRQLPR